MKRFFFAQDCDGHWFLVDADRRSDWDAWTALDGDDEAAWDAPEYAQALGGGYQGFTFTDPKEDR